MIVQSVEDVSTALLMRQHYGAYLRQLRINKGLTKADVCRAVGISESSRTLLSSAEKGRSRIPPADYAACAAIYGVPVHDFAKQLLFYLDPFTYQALFGGENPIDIVSRLGPPVLSEWSLERVARSLVRHKPADGKPVKFKVKNLEPDLTHDDCVNIGWLCRLRLDEINVLIRAAGIRVTHEQTKGTSTPATFTVELLPD